MSAKLRQAHHLRTERLVRKQKFLRSLRFEGLDERLPFADLDDAIGEAISLGTASTTPVIKSDSISPDTDVDMYRISVSAGQTVDFDVDTTLNGPGGLGSFLRLFNASGTEIAWNNDGMAPGDNGIGYDAYLRYTFATGGNYFLSVSNNTNTLFSATTGDGDVAGGANATGSYQLTATLLPIDTDDTLVEAANLGTITTAPDVVNGNIETDIDVDLYKFAVGAGQSVDFDIDTTTNGNPGLESFLRVFDSTGAELFFNDDGVGVDENIIGFDSYLRVTFANAGTYFVGVSNVNNTLYNASTGANDTPGGTNSIGTYTLNVQTTPVAPNDTDDTLNEATNLGAPAATPTTINAAISPAVDVDMYRFTATAGQTITFDIDTTLNGPGGLGTYLRLFNSSGTEIASNNDASAPGEPTVGYDSYLGYTFTTAGTYYLGVSNNNNITYNPSTGAGDSSSNLNATGNYALTVQSFTPDTDDQMSEATSLGGITTSPDTINNSISPDTDVDMFSFTVVAGQVVDFDIDTTINGPGGVDSFLRIFNSSGTEIGFNNNGIGLGENVAVFDSYLRFTFNTAGTYYVGVSNASNTLYNASTGNGDAAGGSNSVGTYTLIVQTAPVIPADGDDAISEAVNLGSISTTPVNTSSAAITFDTDVDMYRFSATAGQVIDFDIDTTLNGPGGLGSFIRLFNPSGTELAWNNDANAPGENTIGYDSYLRYTVPSTGTYYIAVSNAGNTLYNATTGDGDAPGGANATGAYVLTIQALPVDTDDATSEAILIGTVSTSPFTRTDSISTDIDVDMYRFTVSSNDTVDFDVDTTQNGTGGLGSYLRIFDGAGNQLAFNNDAAAPGETTVGFDAYLRHTFTTGGTYYVAVSNNNNAAYSATGGTGDTAGGFNTTGAYTLNVQLFSATPNDTNDAMSEAIVLSAPTTTPNTISSSISPDTDVNMYRFTVTANQTVDFDIDTSLNGPGGLGSYLRLFDSTGAQLSFNNDGLAPGETVLGFDAFLRFTFATAGTYYLGVSNSNNINYNPSTGGSDTAGGTNSTGSYQLIVTSQPLPALTVTAVANTFSELGGSTTATVTRVNTNITQPLIVNLTSSDTTEATVPINVTIPANQASVTFVITGVDDPIVDGTQNVTITASASGLADGTFALQVTDSDTAGATLGLSSVLATFSEAGGTTTGTVTRTNAIITSPLVVNLSSSDTSEATVPATVTIPANQTSITFTITAVDDALVDGTQSVTITATATGLTSATLPLQVTDNDTAPSTLALSSTLGSISESGGTTTGTVTRTMANITQPLVVNLTSSDTGEVTVPATVTIPANQTSVTFTITGVDDLIIDGTQNVLVSATATGLTGATLGIQVTDNDVPTPTLSFTTTLASISELNGTTTATITRNNANLASPLVVNLSSSDTSEASVPANVTIPANQASVTFVITGVDDVIVDGTQNVTITAAATGFANVTAGVQVTDNDSLSTLSLSATATSISELNGVSTGTVTRNTANIGSPLVVNLSSSDTSEAMVPATVTIPAGQVSATFTITAVDDAVVDGAQGVTITATATGLTSATLGIQVTDNDSRWQNPDDPLDVNDDGRITAFDVIPIINWLNLNPAGPVPGAGNDPPPYYDVNSDNLITSFDAITVINYLNVNPVGGEAVAGSAGEDISGQTSRSNETAAADAEQQAAADAYFAALGAQRERERRVSQRD